ncbi:MAG: hypothetical protein IH940_10835 [Acidobacteria bacterium]|nr:hypothetical protein [Acidobacteriota bacterium]
MPISSGPRITARSAVVVGVSGVIAACLLIAFVLWATSSGNIEYKAGDSDFRNIDASEIADEITDRGPITWANPGNNARPIWLQHLGNDEIRGWYAFDARVPGRSGCFAVWDEDTTLFIADCDETLTFPKDGHGLDQFPVRVESGEVIVDINADADDGTVTDG